MDGSFFEDHNEPENSSENPECNGNTHSKLLDEIGLDHEIYLLSNVYMPTLLMMYKKNKR